MFQKKVMNGFREKPLRTDGRTDGQRLNSRFFRILRRTNYTTVQIITITTIQQYNYIKMENNKITTCYT